MYSCLSLRLPRAKKTWWKSLTSKIQSKLHNPKSITKTKRPSISSSRRPKSTSSAALSRPHKYFFLKKRRHRRSLLAPPVYVDKLFVEPTTINNNSSSSSSSSVHVISPGNNNKGAGKKLVVVDHHGHEDHARTIDRTVEKEGDHGGGVGDDEAWEAMQFASPLIRGIDERAEKFIAKFRADMEIQEMLARGL